MRPRGRSGLPVRSANCRGLLGWGRRPSSGACLGRTAARNRSSAVCVTSCSTGRKSRSCRKPAGLPAGGERITTEAGRAVGWGTGSRRNFRWRVAVAVSHTPQQPSHARFLDPESHRAWYINGWQTKAVRISADSRLRFRCVGQVAVGLYGGRFILPGHVGYCVRARTDPTGRPSTK